ncbi:hypothetical protein V9L05_08690 [Bernardetia sp. Wsw4-3y2]|uniref:hypothetical protein n=1 Tax=Bernardetia sp. Wsw4-3y2 TaxID=3127471 RepID=UPI0030D0DDD2
MNFTPIEQDKGLGAVTETGTPPQGAATTTAVVTTQEKENKSLWEKIKNSKILTTVANTAAQNLVSGGNGVNPDVYTNLNPVVQNKSWFEKDTIITSVPNWVTATGGTLLIVGTVWVVTKEEDTPKKRKRR